MKTHPNQIVRLPVLPEKCRLVKNGEKVSGKVYYLLNNSDWIDIKVSDEIWREGEKFLYAVPCANGNHVLIFNQSEYHALIDFPDHLYRMEPENTFDLSNYQQIPIGEKIKKGAIWEVNGKLEPVLSGVVGMRIGQDHNLTYNLKPITDIETIRAEKVAELKAQDIELPNGFTLVLPGEIAKEGCKITAKDGSDRDKDGVLRWWKSDSLEGIKIKEKYRNLVCNPIEQPAIEPIKQIYPTPPPTGFDFVKEGEIIKEGYYILSKDSFDWERGTGGWKNMEYNSNVSFYFANPIQKADTIQHITVGISVPENLQEILDEKTKRNFFEMNLGRTHPATCSGCGNAMCERNHYEYLKANKIPGKNDPSDYGVLDSNGVCPCGIDHRNKPAAEPAIDHIRPDHYKAANGKDTIDKIVRQLGERAAIAFCQGNVIKYNDRAGKKPGNSKEQDLEKAAEYGRRSELIESMIDLDEEFTEMLLKTITRIADYKGKKAAFTICMAMASILQEGLEQGNPRAYVYLNTINEINLLAKAFTN